MKKLTCELVALFVLVATVGHAMPSLQHSVKGIVCAVDIERRILTLEPGKKDSPTEFDVVEGRTWPHRDGQAAALAELRPGQSVQVYYKREMGRNVATEVNWNTVTASPAPPSRPCVVARRTRLRRPRRVRSPRFRPCSR